MTGRGDFVSVWVQSGGLILNIFFFNKYNPCLPQYKNFMNFDPLFFDK